MLHGRTGKPWRKHFYRRLAWSKIWHFCRDCHYWPTEHFIERAGRPAREEHCYFCWLKEKWSKCDRTMPTAKEEEWASTDRRISIEDKRD